MLPFTMPLFRRSAFAMAALLIRLGSADTADFNIMDFNAVPDGVAYCTEAIQQAVDKAAADGAGVVVIPKGRFLTRRIELRSNITLRLSEGAHLLGPPTPQEYQGQHYLLWAHDASNITITGPGTIDGQAIDDPSNAFWTVTKSAGLFYKKRPETEKAGLFFLFFRNCTNLHFEGFTLQHSPGWSILTESFDHVSFQGLTLRNSVFGPNTDGLDLVGCSHVSIDHCAITTCDDAIVLKTNPKNMTCEHVRISHCQLSSPSYGFKIGTETAGKFDDIELTNSTITAPDARGTRGGVSLQCVDGGSIEHVTLKDLQLSGARAPIFIRLGARLRYGAKQPGGLRDVLIENLKATSPQARDWSSSIAGLPDHPVENLTLKGIDLTVTGSQSADKAQREVPEEATKYPDAQMFGDLPSFGFYLRHVKGLKLENVRITCVKPDARPALVCDNVAGLVLDQVQVAPGHGPAVEPAAPMLQSRGSTSTKVTQAKSDDGVFTLTTQASAP
ncbi:MAG: glycoside hydrolase family 28 protein [Prosthecobacter sp.]|uniref:glycoside hydrolase family 28 protein n=1 Tax=Prosthecobacter sp. TaxID=1965333 RepID=UPI0038FE2B69